MVESSTRFDPSTMTHLGPFVPFVLDEEWELETPSFLCDFEFFLPATKVMLVNEYDMILTFGLSCRLCRRKICWHLMLWTGLSIIRGKALWLHLAVHVLAVTW